MSTGTGVNVSKANTYAVLEKPLALNVSKAGVYVVLEKPLALNVSKANTYVVLIPVNSNPPVWPSLSFANGVLGSTYSQQWDLSPAASPTTYTLKSGTLPPGLVLSSPGADLGVLSGTPTTIGVYSFTLTATNAYGVSSQQFSIEIVKPAAGAAAPVISGSLLGYGIINTAYDNPLTITGGTAPYVVTVSSGALPPGITLAGQDLSGTPTTIGTYNFGLTVTDANDSSTTQEFTIVVITPDAPVAYVASLADGATYQPYNETVLVEGGTPGYTFAVTGQLPPGLSLNPNTGVISGIPTAIGTFTFTVAVTDSHNVTGATTFNIHIVRGTNLETAVLPQHTNVLSKQSGFLFPMIQTGPQGRVRYAHNDSTDLIQDSILQILLTIPGERMWNPTFGCRVRLVQFDNYGPHMNDTIKTLILEAIKLWEPRVTVTSKDITILSSTDIDTKLKVTINYTVNNPDNAASQTGTAVVTF